jgi:hypothetical protein
MVYAKDLLIPISWLYQPVKPQAIFVFLDTTHQTPNKIFIHRLIDGALEYGFLHSLPEVLAHLRNSAEAPFPFRRF